MTFKIDQLINLIVSTLPPHSQDGFKGAFSSHLVYSTKILFQKVPTYEEYVASFKHACTSYVTTTPLIQGLIELCLDPAKEIRPRPTKKILTSNGNNKSNSGDTKASTSMGKLPDGAVPMDTAVAKKKSSVTNLLPTVSSSLSSGAKVRELSAQTSNLVMLALKSAVTAAQTVPLYKYCSSKCTKCIEVLKKIPLTKCNHERKCNDVGLFPHLSRNTWKAVHANPNLSLQCNARTYRNPFDCGSLGTENLASPGGSRDTGLPSVASENISTDRNENNKRPRLDENLGVNLTQIPVGLHSAKCPCGLPTKKNARGNRNCPNKSCTVWQSYKAAQIKSIQTRF